MAYAKGQTVYTYLFTGNVWEWVEGEVVESNKKVTKIKTKSGGELTVLTSSLKTFKPSYS
jgi:hypothetical protein